MRQKYYNEIIKIRRDNTKEFLPDLEITPPYPAKMLKRQGLFTFHILLKYPKNFKQLNFSFLRLFIHKLTHVRSRSCMGS